MATILNNKYYLYSHNELIGGFMDWKGKFQRPDIHLTSKGEWWNFTIDICGKEGEFYVKKGALKKYELQAIYCETFYNYIFNGHSYIRPEMAVNAEDIVVDAGGCEGFYSRYALNMGASKVIIFEPCKELAEGLKKTFEDEISTGRVLIIEKALGRRAHKNKLYIDPNMFCASSMDENEVNANALEQEIMVTSLDEILQSMGIGHVDIIKMDIEGAEIDAVIGMRRTIKKCHPKMMIATYHSYYNAIKIRKICRDLHKDYQCKVFGCYFFERPFRPYMTFCNKEFDD